MVGSTKLKASPSIVPNDGAVDRGAAGMEVHHWRQFRTTINLNIAVQLLRIELLSQKLCDLSAKPHVRYQSALSLAASFLRLAIRSFLFTYL